MSDDVTFSDLGPLAPEHDRVNAAIKKFFAENPRKGLPVGDVKIFLIENLKANTRGGKDEPGTSGHFGLDLGHIYLDRDAFEADPFLVVQELAELLMWRGFFASRGIPLGLAPDGTPLGKAREWIRTNLNRAREIADEFHEEAAKVQEDFKKNIGSRYDAKPPRIRAGSIAHQVMLRRVRFEIRGILDLHAAEQSFSLVAKEIQESKSRLSEDRDAADHDAEQKKLDQLYRREAMLISRQRQLEQIRTAHRQTFEDEQSQERAKLYEEIVKKPVSQEGPRVRVAKGQGAVDLSPLRIRPGFEQLSAEEAQVLAAFARSNSRILFEDEFDLTQEDLDRFFESITLLGTDGAGEAFAPLLQGFDDKAALDLSVIFERLLSRSHLEYEQRKAEGYRALSYRETVTLPLDGQVIHVVAGRTPLVVAARIQRDRSGKMARQVMVVLTDRTGRRVADPVELKEGVPLIIGKRKVKMKQDLGNGVREFEAEIVTIGGRPFTANGKPFNDWGWMASSMSSEHLELTLQDGNLVVRDLGSAGGSWVRKEAAEVTKKAAAPARSQKATRRGRPNLAQFGEATDRLTAHKARTFHFGDEVFLGLSVGSDRPVVRVDREGVSVWMGDQYIDASWDPSLERQEISIGRRDDGPGIGWVENGSLYVIHPDVSWDHLKITKTKKLVIIEDVGSSNGTYLFGTISAQGEIGKTGTDDVTFADLGALAPGHNFLNEKIDGLLEEKAQGAPVAPADAEVGDEPDHIEIFLIKRLKEATQGADGQPGVSGHFGLRLGHVYVDEAAFEEDPTLLVHEMTELLMWRGFLRDRGIDISEARGWIQSHLEEARAVAEMIHDKAVALQENFRSKVGRKEGESLQSLAGRLANDIFGERRRFESLGMLSTRDIEKKVEINRISDPRVVNEKLRENGKRMAELAASKDADLEVKMEYAGLVEERGWLKQRGRELFDAEEAKIREEIEKEAQAGESAKKSQKPTPKEMPAMESFRKSPKRVDKLRLHSGDGVTLGLGLDRVRTLVRIRASAEGRVIITELDGQENVLREKEWDPQATGEKEIILGRESSSWFVVGGRFASRRHLRITKEGDEVVVYDLGQEKVGSTNGTWLVEAVGKPAREWRGPRTFEDALKEMLNEVSPWEAPLIRKNMSDPRFRGAFERAKKKNVIFFIALDLDGFPGWMQKLLIDFADSVVQAIEEIPDALLQKSASPLSFGIGETGRAYGLAHVGRTMAPGMVGMEKHWKEDFGVGEEEEGLSKLFGTVLAKRKKVDQSQLRKTVVHELIGHKLFTSRGKDGRALIRPETLVEFARANGYTKLYYLDAAARRKIKQGGALPLGGIPSVAFEQVLRMDEQAYLELLRGLYTHDYYSRILEMAAFTVQGEDLTDRNTLFKWEDSRRILSESLLLGEGLEPGIHHAYLFNPKTGQWEVHTVRLPNEDRAASAVGKGSALNKAREVQPTPAGEVLIQADLAIFRKSLIEEKFLFEGAVIHPVQDKPDGGWVPVRLHQGLSQLLWRLLGESQKAGFHPKWVAQATAQFQKELEQAAPGNLKFQQEAMDQFVVYLIIRKIEDLLAQGKVGTFNLEGHVVHGEDYLVAFSDKEKGIVLPKEALPEGGLPPEMAAKLRLQLLVHEAYASLFPERTYADHQKIVAFQARIFGVQEVEIIRILLRALIDKYVPLPAPTEVEDYGRPLAQGA